MPINYTYLNYVDRVHEAVNKEFPNINLSKQKVSRILRVFNWFITTRLNKGHSITLDKSKIVPWYHINVKGYFIKKAI